MRPGSKNPEYCVSPASQSPYRLIGSSNPCNKGGLAGRQTLSYRNQFTGGEGVCKLFVGIDISKETSSAHGLDENGESRFSMTFSMNEEGFSKLYKALKNNCKVFAEAMVAMESTACYHINLFSFLTSKGINAIVINPLLIANFAKLSLRKTKTDKKDALTIARFILANKDSVSQIAISQDLQDLRDLAR